MSGITTRLIDPSVMLNKAAQRFDRIDSNQDGMLSFEETLSSFKELGLGEDQHQRFVRRFDLDSTLSISRTEYDQVIQSAITRLTENQPSSGGSGSRPASAPAPSPQAAVESQVSLEKEHRQPTIEFKRQIEVAYEQIGKDDR